MAMETTSIPPLMWQIQAAMESSPHVCPERRQRRHRCPGHIGITRLRRIEIQESLLETAWMTYMYINMCI